MIDVAHYLKERKRANEREGGKVDHIDLKATLLEQDLCHEAQEKVQDR